MQSTMETNTNTKISYTLLIEQEAPGQWWWVSGPSGFLCAGATLTAALEGVPQAIANLLMASAIVPKEDSNER